MSWRLPGRPSSISSTLRVPPSARVSTSCNTKPIHDPPAGNGPAGHIAPSAHPQSLNTPEPGRPRLARSRRSDRGPRQEVEKAKLSGNRRGVGWVHSTGETLEQSREERWRRGRREGTQSEEEVDAEARSGHSAGFGVSQEADRKSVV